MKKPIALKLKYIRPTATEHGHTAVSLRGEQLGYFMPNRSPASGEHENYNFVGKVICLDAASRNALICKIEATFRE